MEQKRWRMGLNILRFNIFSFLKYQKQKIQKSPRYLLTLRVKNYLKSNTLSNMTVLEQKELIRFLSSHLIEVFNYNFIGKYRYRNIKVYSDKENGLNYVVTADQKKIYFKRNMQKKTIRSVYNFFCAEQDDKSPHNYCFSPFEVTPDTVIVDVGAAEGNFGLKFIDQIKKLYIFECDNDWIEALETTFSPWKDKVEIIKKYVSNKSDENTISLDHFFRQIPPPTLIKVDVEGAELNVLDGACTLFQKQSIEDVLICTYHRHGDEQNISHYLDKYNYNNKTSPGHMLFYLEKPNYSLKPPYDFRKGLIHAKKNR